MSKVSEVFKKTKSTAKKDEKDKDKDDKKPAGKGKNAMLQFIAKCKKSE